MEARLAEVARIRTGFSFRGKVADDPMGDLAVLQTKDVDATGHLAPTGCTHIKSSPVYAGHLLEPGDIVVQSRGSTFPAGLVDTSFHGIAAIGLHVVRPLPALLSAYLVWLFNHPAVQATLSGLARGSRTAFLSKADLADLRIPVPSRETQQRIVRVATLQQEADRLAAQLQRLHNQYAAAVAWRAAHRT